MFVSECETALAIVTGLHLINLLVGEGAFFGRGKKSSILSQYHELHQSNHAKTQDSCKLRIGLSLSCNA